MAQSEAMAQMQRWQGQAEDVSEFKRRQVDSLRAELNRLEQEQNEVDHLRAELGRMQSSDDYAEVAALPADEPTAAAGNDDWLAVGKTVFFAEPDLTTALTYKLVKDGAAATQAATSQSTKAFTAKPADAFHGAMRSRSAQAILADGVGQVLQIDANANAPSQPKPKRRPSSATTYSATAAGYSSTEKQPFVSSFPKGERALPTYDARRDPHCTRYHEPPVDSYPTNEAAIASAARLQMAQLKRSREQYYRRSQAMALARHAAEAAYHDTLGHSTMGFHPAGYGFRPNLGVAPTLSRPDATSLRADRAGSVGSPKKALPQDARSGGSARRTQPPEVIPEWRGGPAAPPSKLGNDPKLGHDLDLTSWQRTTRRTVTDGGGGRHGSARRSSLLDQVGLVPSKSQYQQLLLQNEERYRKELLQLELQPQMQLHAPRGEFAALVLASGSDGDGGDGAGETGALHRYHTERPRWDSSTHDHSRVLADARATRAAQRAAQRRQAVQAQRRRDLAMDGPAAFIHPSPVTTTGREAAHQGSSRGEGRQGSSRGVAHQGSSGGSGSSGGKGSSGGTDGGAASGPGARNGAPKASLAPSAVPSAAPAADGAALLSVPYGTPFVSRLVFLFDRQLSARNSSGGSGSGFGSARRATAPGSKEAVATEDFVQQWSKEHMEVRMQIGKFRSPPLNVLAEDTLPSGAELQRMQRTLVHEASSEAGPKPPPTKLARAEVIAMLEFERQRLRDMPYQEADAYIEARGIEALVRGDVDEGIQSLATSADVAEQQARRTFEDAAESYIWGPEVLEPNTRHLEHLIDNLKAAGLERSGGSASADLPCMPVLTTARSGSGGSASVRSPSQGGSAELIENGTGSSGATGREACRQAGGARAAEYAFLSSDDFGAFACVAEVESVAAAATVGAAWRGAELRRFGVPLVQRLLEAVAYEPHAPPALAAESASQTSAAFVALDVAIGRSAAAMRARIVALWQACGLDTAALQALLKRMRQAVATSEEETLTGMRAALSAALKPADIVTAITQLRAALPNLDVKVYEEAILKYGGDLEAAKIAILADPYLGAKLTAAEPTTTPSTAPTTAPTTALAAAESTPTPSTAPIAPSVEWQARAQVAATSGAYPVVAHRGAARVFGAENAQLASLLLALRLHAERTLLVASAIAHRESLCRHLRLACARLVPMYAAYARSSRLDTVPGTGTVAPAKGMIEGLEAEVMSSVSLLRQATVKVVEAVTTWRAGLSTPVPVLWPVAIAARMTPHHAANDSAASNVPRAVMLTTAMTTAMNTAMNAAMSDKGAGGGRANEGSVHVARHATPTPPRAAVTSNYMRQMATDLDGLADESPEIRRLLNSAPSRLDSRRLWRARQTIGLEPHAELRFELAGAQAALNWKPVSATVLMATQCAKGDSAPGSIVEVLPEDDRALLAALVG